MTFTTIQPWIQESTVTIPAGTHTLTWTAYGGDYASDAGFVDQVTFTPINRHDRPPIRTIPSRPGQRPERAYARRRILGRALSFPGSARAFDRG